jgi:hypothetical protein
MTMVLATGRASFVMLSGTETAASLTERLGLVPTRSWEVGQVDGRGKSGHRHDNAGNHWSAAGFEFCRDDLSRLKPGLILAESFDAKGHDPGRALLSPARFAIAACRASGTSTGS